MPHRAAPGEDGEYSSSGEEEEEEEEDEEGGEGDDPSKRRRKPNPKYVEPPAKRVKHRKLHRGAPGAGASFDVLASLAEAAEKHERAPGAPLMPTPPADFVVEGGAATDDDEGAAQAPPKPPLAGDAARSPPVDMDAVAAAVRQHAAGVEEAVGSVLGQPSLQQLQPRLQAETAALQKSLALLLSGTTTATTV